MSPASRGDYDGIILGSGHNSLVLQAYLGRAGLKTVCLERREVAGGGLATVEIPSGSGFLHNTHSFFHRALNRMPWYTDLDLERRGAVYLEPPLNVALLLRDGRALEWWTDFELTAESVARFSRRDADTLRRWREAFIPILETILVPESQSPPLPPDARRRLLEKTPEGRMLLEVSALSPLEFVRRELEDPVVQAGMLFFNGLREVDLRSRGFGHHIPALLASRSKAQMCRGGSASLARALVDAVRDTGGDVVLGVEPARIRVEGGRAVAVETSGGDLFRARQFIASGLNPQQTFLDLIRSEDLDGPWRAQAAAYRYNLLAPLFALNVNLREPPAYTAARENPEVDQAFMVILGLEHARQFPEIVAHHEAGTIPPPVLWGACPTRFDPTQAPAGAHTAFLWEKVPYRLGGDPRSWDGEKTAHARRRLELWKEYAPNLGDAVLELIPQSPLDTERALANMRDGDLLVGSLSEGQTGANRPFAGAGNYRTPVPGLYLCGSCCHPGGNITGLPGYNCAQVLLTDLHLPAPWAPRPMEERL